MKGTGGRRIRCGAGGWLEVVGPNRTWRIVRNEAACFNASPWCNAPPHDTDFSPIPARSDAWFAGRHRQVGQRERSNGDGGTAECVRACFVRGNPVGMTMDRLRRWRFRFECVAAEAAASALPPMRHGALRLLAHGLGGMVHRFDHRGRRAARENLRVVFGGERSEGWIRDTALASYRGFARSFLELFWLAEGGRAKVGKLIEGEDDLAGPEAHHNPAGCIYVTPHFGNFEVGATYTALTRGLDLVVAQDFANPGLTPIVRRTREWAGARVIPQRQAMLRLLRLMRRGGSTGLVTDLTVKPEAGGTVIREFGRLTCVTPIHAELARRTGASLVPTIVTPSGRAGYRITYDRPLATAGRSAQEIAQACWDAFEPVIRAQPSGWMWMYKHWRYLPADAPRDAYPDYANRSKKFDRLSAAVLGESGGAR